MRIPLSMVLFSLGVGRYELMEGFQFERSLPMGQRKKEEKCCEG